MPAASCTLRRTFPTLKRWRNWFPRMGCASRRNCWCACIPATFRSKPKMFADERGEIHALESKYPHVHVVRPVALGGSLGYYSGEDMDEKSSMMAHSDVMVTVYSTMLVETAVHDTPMIAAVIDTPGGWNRPKKYSLSLEEDRQLAHAPAFPRGEGGPHCRGPEGIVRGDQCVPEGPGAGFV